VVACNGGLVSDGGFLVPAMILFLVPQAAVMVRGSGDFGVTFNIATDGG